MFQSYFQRVPLWKTVNPHRFKYYMIYPKKRQKNVNDVFRTNQRIILTKPDIWGNKLMRKAEKIGSNSLPISKILLWLIGMFQSNDAAYISWRFKRLCWNKNWEVFIRDIFEKHESGIMFSRDTKFQRTFSLFSFVQFSKKFHNTKDICWLVVITKDDLTFTGVEESCDDSDRCLATHFASSLL